MGEGVWVNSSSSNAGSGSERSSTLTSSSTTRTSSEDDEAIIADALFRVAMDHIIDVEPDRNCLFRAVSQQVYGDAKRHLEASVVEIEREKTWHSIRRIAYSTSKLLVGFKRNQAGLSQQNSRVMCSRRFLL